MLENTIPKKHPNPKVDLQEPIRLVNSKVRTATDIFNLFRFFEFKTILKEISFTTPSNRNGFWIHLRLKDERFDNDITMTGFIDYDTSFLEAVMCLNDYGIRSVRRNYGEDYEPLINKDKEFLFTRNITVMRDCLKGHDFRIEEILINISDDFVRFDGHIKLLNTICLPFSYSTVIPGYISPSFVRVRSRGFKRKADLLREQEEDRLGGMYNG